MNNNLIKRIVSVFLFSLGASQLQISYAEGSLSRVVIKNVNIFDGVSEELLENRHVLIEGDAVHTISNRLMDDAGAEVIDGKGMTLMPGLIDAHWHTTMASASFQEVLHSPPGFIDITAAKEAEATLMRGVTTVRDLGGPSFGLVKAVNEGVVPGPRIYPAGAIISQTSGHADFRSPNELHPRFGGHTFDGALTNSMIIADGVAEVRAAVREQLRRGATHIKLTAGGGVSSPSDPIDVTQFSLEELKAAVGSAEDWGTYVTVHAYTPRAVRRSIEAGVKVIDHGQLLDEKTLKLMVKKGIWLSIQPFLDCEAETSSPQELEKWLIVCKGTADVYELIKKQKNLKVAWGTDLLGSPKEAAKQVQMLSILQPYFTPYQLLKMATSTNAELLTLSGKRNPYPKKLGVVEEGAYADLLLVDGDPTENIDVLLNQDNLVVILKDGVVYKNTLSQK